MLTSSVIKLVIIAVYCGVCLTIKVPVSWENSDIPNHNSSVDDADKNSQENADERDKASGFISKTFDEWTPKNVEPQKPYEKHDYQNEWVTTKPVPVQYFETPLKKPQFAEDVDSKDYQGNVEEEEKGPEIPLQTTSYEQTPEYVKSQEPPVKKDHEFVNEWVTKKPIPVQYFEYPSNKPQFAVDVATFHNVPAPQKQYHSYPIQPHTGQSTPNLVQHRIPQKGKPIFDSFQNFMNNHDGLTRYLNPALSNYEIFHPYKAEEPALQNVYKDPYLQKIRDDVEENKKRLQKYEKDAVSANYQKEDNLKSPEKTDEELFGQQYQPNRFEEYKAEKRPLYYSPSPKQYLPHRTLNRKLKYPLPGNHIKIKPIHYQPLRHHLQRLRYKHGKRYGDENNEYPQVNSRYKESFAEPPEGYDIYDDGKKKFEEYRHDVDIGINNYSNKYTAPSYNNDESSNLNNGGRHEDKTPEQLDEEEFVPIKMYAQVRKSESFKHLPREAAYDDAETPEEIINAPRLKEAVKSTKAHTIYSEEGYEDNAYDHAGQQKHASNHEGHGGFLKEKENSGGRYKIPYVSHDFDEGDGVAAGNAYTHKNKWSDDERISEEQNHSDIKKDNEDQNENDEYDLREAGSENVHIKNEPKASLLLSQDSERTTIMDEKDRTSIKTETEHIVATNKRDGSHGEQINPSELNASNKINIPKISREKREANFQIPKFDFKNTYLTEAEILELSKKSLPLIKKQLEDKYPYYLNSNLNPNSPLRYAENLKYIPHKTTGGTEFYDSRSAVKCSEVEREIDPIPEKLKKSNQNEEDQESDGETVSDDYDFDKNQNVTRKKRQADFSNLKKSPRLHGLGDKIDCYKDKYFGNDPLDSPFFYEDVIHDPEPLSEPVIEVFKVFKPIQPKVEPVMEPSELIEIITNESAETKEIENLIPIRSEEVQNYSTEPKPHDSSSTDILDKIKPGAHSTNSDNNNITMHAESGKHHTYVYSDIMQNIQNSLENQLSPSNTNDKIVPLLLSTSKDDNNLNNVTNFQVYLNKEDITIRPLSHRVKRSSQFVYEPYKILRGNIDHDSKKTTTSINVSPLIKQLQASKIVDNASRVKDGDKMSIRIAQPVKRNVKVRNYKNIRKEDRAKRIENDEDDKDFIDVSEDKRRGEPRYELSNHKAKYTPVVNSKSISLQDYRSIANPKKESLTEPDTKIDGDITTESKPTEAKYNTYPRPYFDVSSYIPTARQTSTRDHKKDTNVASESVSQPVRRRHKDIHKKSEETTSTERAKSLTTENPESGSGPYQLQLDNNDESEEYEEEYEESDSVTTTTTTRKPIKVRRKIKIRTTTTTTSTVKPDDVVEYIDYKDIEEITTTSKPKIKIVRRLRKPASINTGQKDKINNKTPKVNLKIIKQNIKPKIQEKTVKSQKSTVMTDSTSYGDDDDEDSQKDQIDAMVGGEHMLDYINEYEKPKNRGKNIETEDLIQSSGGDAVTEDIYDDKHVSRETSTKEQSDGDYEDSEDDNEEEAESTKPDGNIKVIRKKIKVNKDLPIIKSPGHSSNYQEAIEEEEMIRKNSEEESVVPLQMYQDENLAQDINKLAEKHEIYQRRKLSDVEVFKDDLKLKKGPRHGGNYRSAKLIEDLDEHENEKPHLHGGNLKATNRDEPEQGHQTGRSASLLNTLAQAATVLTTTPKYILDPSKRMYYYVDTR